MKSFCHLVLLAVLAAGTLRSTVYAAETNSFISYKMLDDMWQPMSKLDPSKLEVRALLRSTNHAVARSDITLTIHSPSEGMIPVILNTNAQIVRVPHDDTLVKENPPIVSNQPKGTLRLIVYVTLPRPDALTFRYDRLGDGVAEINRAIRLQAGWAMSLFAPKIKGVIFFFPKTNAANAAIEIASASGKQKWTADKNGQIKLPLDSALLKENPEVQMSEMPQSIVPDTSALN